MVREIRIPEHTNDPVCALEQFAASFLPPDVDARVNLDDARDLFERALDALDFRGAYVSQHCSRVSVQ